MILLQGLLITAGLTAGSAPSYAHNQQRLTSLQIRLTASVAQTAHPQLQADLGRVTDPVLTFRAAMAGDLTVRDPLTLGHRNGGIWPGPGARPCRFRPWQGLTSKATTRVFLQAPAARH